MKPRSPRFWALLGVTVAGAVLALSLTPAPASGRADDDLDEQQELAIKAAVKDVAPSVVKIETSGGTEVVQAGPGPRGMVRRGVGPTTGVIVSPDGYIISSSFNFANKPSTIRVALPGQKERRVAHVVATDQTRMLTLLKITKLPPGTKLPVPKFTPKKEMEIGQTAIAVGRTLTADADGLPSVSVGIISATDRIWGKAIQTDAKVSPTNYGGPLVDLQGRVQGILVPASPTAEGELAGLEWYDSGIGFAVPLEDINSVVPRMVKGTEKEPVVLKRGFMGVTMRSNDIYEAAPIIGTVAPGSAAEKAGIKVGDLVKEVDGRPVRNYAQVMHRLGGKYEGDIITLKLERDKKEVTLDKVALGSAEAAFAHAFLGILPVRDDPDPGVEVRYVYPKSPADAAGIKAGDRIMKVNNPIIPAAPPLPITRGRDQLLSVIEICRPGQELKLEVKPRAGAVKTVTVKLADLPPTVPGGDDLKDTRSTAKKALVRPGEKPAAKKKDKDKEDEKDEDQQETGLLKKTTPAKTDTYWIYVPDTYDRNEACAVLVWLHPLGKNKEKDFESFSQSWSDFCDTNKVILIMPQSDSPRGWTPNEAPFVTEAIRTVASTYTIDPRRVVAHGMGVGGEMAFYLGFQSRNQVRGVATVGAHMGGNPRERVVNQPLSFFLVVGNKDPILKAVRETKEKLDKFKYPLMLREVNNMGHEYIDGKIGVPALEELVRWIDTLDRI